MKKLFKISLLFTFLFFFSLVASADDGESLWDIYDNEMPICLSDNPIKCGIFDDYGAITSAYVGDVVRLEITHPQMTGMSRVFFFQMPSNDDKYEDIFVYAKNYAGTSLGATIYMKIQPYEYIGGEGLFTGIVRGVGRCSKTLKIRQ